MARQMQDLEDSVSKVQHIAIIEMVG
jgi:hypothetical protein